MKPSGCSINTCSCDCPYKKTLLTSSYLTSQPCSIAKENTKLAVVDFTRRLSLCLVPKKYQGKKKKMLKKYIYSHVWLHYKK